MKYILAFCFFLIYIFSFGQNSSDNWKVYLNSDTVPLQLYNDSDRIIHLTNPETDYLTFVQIKGEPTTGKIYFYSGKDTPSGMNYPLPVAKYKLNAPTVVQLKKVAKNYSKEHVNGLIIQLAFVCEKTIRPIVLVKFKTD